MSDATPAESSREPEDSSGAEAAESTEDDDADEAPDSASAGFQREPAALPLPSKAGTPPQWPSSPTAPVPSCVYICTYTHSFVEGTLKLIL